MDGVPKEDVGDSVAGFVLGGYQPDVVLALGARRIQPVGHLVGDGAAAAQVFAAPSSNEQTSPPERSPTSRSVNPPHPPLLAAVIDLDLAEVGVAQPVALEQL